jgi:hypothetical protein
MNLLSLCRRFVASSAGAALVSLFATLSLSAAPSGGPYGPVQLRYEVPQAKHVFYVAPDGKAGNSGASVEQPTTLEAAIERVTTGDAIILRGGVYRTGGLRLSQGITMQPYADERPVIKGTEVATEWKTQPNGLWRTAWKKFFPAKPADWWRREFNARRTPLHLFNNDMVFFDGEQLGQVGGEHEVNEDSFYIDYENGNVYLGRNPEGHLVEITTQDSALIRTIADAHGKKNDGQGPKIRGITFTQYAYRALEVEGTEPQKYSDPSTFGKEIVGTVLENLTISFCSRVAGYFRGDNFVMRNCLVSDCGTEGIYVINSADILLERNIVTRTNSAEKISGYFASSIKIFNQSYRAVVRDNLIIDNPNASGCWFDVGEVDAVFVNNWVENTNDGFFFEISKGAICAGNVFVNCNKGTRVLNSSNVQLYQNTYYNSLAFFDRSERSAVGDHFGWHPSTGPGVTERHGHVFENNLMAADERFKGPLAQFTQSAKIRDQVQEPHVKALDANVYVRRVGAKAQPLVEWGPVPGTEKNRIDVFDLAEITKLHPEFAVHSRAFPDYRGPLFRAPELSRFDLLAAFPGANVGSPLPDRVREVLGWKKGANPFPGAYVPAE